MKIKAPKDFWAGLMFIAFGIGFLIVAQNYAMGTAVRMGPAYFPTVLGGLLALIGLAIFVESFIAHGEKVPRIVFRPMTLIIVAIVLFGVLLKPLGMIVSTAILIVLGALGGHEFRMKEVVILYAILVVFAVLVFVRGLGLPIPVCPAVLDDACRSIGIGI
ncbi:MAG TPA: tripartite tricarboxylate transporter TctB family protein [Burkholderiales bacterium]|nr:tripartite tricarboxylate transporter TctB family protein [Burkholderiales bacterium]